MKPRALLLGCATGAFVLTTAAAQAATKTVFMGLPSQDAAKQFQALNGDVNAFFPRKVTVHAGDAVSFVPAGFHNLDLPAKGGKAAELFSAGDPIADAKDAAGAAFWFNGLPALGFNPALFDSAFGKTVTYNGKTGVQSGLPLGEDLDPVVVKFARKGTFTYYCDVHPGMKGQVKVVGAKAAAPSKKSDAKRVKKQLATALAALKRLQKTETGSGTIQIGAAAPGGVESFDFFPAATTVAPGTTVTFTMPVKSVESHTATTGPGNPIEEPDSYLGQIAASFEGPAPSQLAIYPSEQPGGTPASLTKTLHGNGFWNSGVMDAVAATPPAQSNQVTFAEAGTYDFYCLIHPFMKATVTVSS